MYLIKVARVGTKHEVRPEADEMTFTDTTISELKS